MRGGRLIQLNERQKQIIDFVKEKGPVTSDDIAQVLETTRASLRSDLTFLTQLGMLEAKPRVGYFYNESKNRYDIFMRMIELNVQDYQSVPIVVDETASAYDALVSLFLNNIGTLFVLNDKGHLEGVLSRKDLLKLAVGVTDMQKVPVGVVMTRMPNIILTTPDESLWTAAKKIITHEIDGLPVVRKNDEGGFDVIGRFTKTNVTRAFVDIGYGSAGDVMNGQ